MLTRTLAALTLAWPLLLAGGWWSLAHDGPPALAAGVYFAAGRVCHQRPERSFFSDGVKWPVCGRCAGLYLAAPLGAALALAARRQRQGSRAIGLAAVAAAPAALTFVLEWSGMPMSSIARALSALPAGAALAFLIVSVTRAANLER
jgi:uncharacterized membrane protein